MLFHINYLYICKCILLKSRIKNKEKYIQNNYMVHI